MSSECDSVLWQLEELDRATQMAEQDFARFKVRVPGVRRRAGRGGGRRRGVAFPIDSHLCQRRCGNAGGGGVPSHPL